MPKSKHYQHNQRKSEKLQLRLTPEGKEKLEQLTAAMGMSISELLEQLSRGQIAITPVRSLGESLTS
uniref:ribbon-helix-helix protein, CopG family n=1 Tax=Microseira wollei TaxID=467598 RepID=UPI001CFE9880